MIPWEDVTAETVCGDCGVKWGEHFQKKRVRRDDGTLPPRPCSYFERPFVADAQNAQTVAENVKE